MSDFGCNQATLQEHDFSKWGLSPREPLHLLLGRESRRSNLANVVFHTTSVPLPKEAFVRIAPMVCATSPEFSIIDAFANMDRIEALLVAYELCGCYSIRPDLEKGLMQRPPLCSRESLADLLDKLSAQKPVQGMKPARCMLRCIANGSGSPRETALTLLLCLPMNYGGFGLPFPELNVNLNLNSDGKLLWGASNSFDLVWKNAKLVIEYDGIDGHSEDHNIARDAQRRDALAASGFSVFVITRKQLNNVGDTYAIANAAAKILGKPLRFRSKRFRDAHMNLRSKVL